jgi:type II secretory pathway component GspD/PulD (secretin)
MKLSIRIFALALASSIVASAALAQPATSKPASDPSSAPKADRERLNADDYPEQTIYLKNASDQNEINEYASTVRQLLPPYAKVMMVPSQGALIIRAAPEDVNLAISTLDNLDRPRKTWRLTYTVSEMDGDKRVGAQHYSFVAVSGQQTSLKQGDRVPIITGKTGSSSLETQITYQDVGMLFTATLDELHNGDARLRSDVEQSSVGPQNQGTVDPVFRHSELRGEATLLPGKPLVLGTMDMPSSTHHLQIEVLMEPLP